MCEHPFWSDSFDMDLLKVIPNAREIIAPVADLELTTTGHLTHGRLNHPCVWNHDLGLVAFFGFGDPRRPEVFVTSAPVVRCTAMEAFRDAWAHSYVMLVEGRPIWDAGALWSGFQDIMWDLRGWEQRQSKRARGVDVTEATLKHAVASLRAIAGKLQEQQNA